MDDTIREIHERKRLREMTDERSCLSANIWDSMRPDSTSNPPLELDKLTASDLTPGQTKRVSACVDETKREIFIHTPKDYSPDKQAPVVVVFNGWGDKPGPGGTKAGAAGLAELTGLDAKSDDKGFFVVYMSGNPRKDLSYNNGQYPFSKTDDVKFTSEVLDALNKSATIDNDRIHVAGYSQGASFAHKVAAELPEKYRPASLIDVSGWTTGKEHPAPEGMSLLTIQSGKDTVAPQDGRWFGLHMDSEAKTIDRYLQANKLALSVPYSWQSIDEQVKVQTWKNPSNGAEVKSVYMPTFAGHDWHGGAGSNAPVNATNLLIDFIDTKSRHPK